MRSETAEAAAAATRAQLVGHVPAPPSKHNAGASDVLQGSVFAYGVSTAIAVVDLQSSEVIGVLHEGDSGGTVTCVRWFPGCHDASSRAAGAGASHLRLAAGDTSGPRVPVGPGARFWRCCWPPAPLLLLDPRDGARVWAREWHGAALTCLTRDPLDQTHVCACGEEGAIVSLRFLNPRAERVEVKQYALRTGAGSAAAVRCCFLARTRELLFVMCEAEVVIFDLELGGPVSRIARPPRLAAFSRILDVQAERSLPRSSQGDGRGSGVDFLLCLHTDGCLSVWSCYQSKALQGPLHGPHAVTAGSELIPSAVALPPKRLSSRKSRDDGGAAAGAGDAAEDVDTSRSAQTALGSTAVAPRQESLVVAVVTADCRVWTWDIDWAPAPGPAAAKQAVPPVALSLPKRLPTPRLVSLQAALPQGVTSFAVCPTPVAAGPGPAAFRAMVTVAAVTGNGMVNVLTLRMGLGGQLLPVISVSLEVHKEVIRGLRWLGSTPRLVSFSCKKEQHGWRNCIILTDMQSRASLPFREVGPEISPMLAVRSSPSGRYLLILFRGAPAEIWVVGATAAPQRVRVLDLPFTCVEWVLPSDAAHAPDTPSKWAKWSLPAPPGPRAPSAPKGEDAQSADAEYPEERLAFALADGRVGMLAVKGRRIADTQPRRPSWGLLAGSECVGMALAAWGTNVLLGDAEGNLLRWDTSTGRSSSLATGMGPVRKVQVAPCGLMVPRHAGPPSMWDPIAKVAVLFSSGQWGIWELDARSSIRPVPVTSQLDAEGAGSVRMTGLYWLPLPRPGGTGGMLAAATEDTSLAFISLLENSAAPGASTPKTAPSTPSAGLRGDVMEAFTDVASETACSFPQSRPATILALPPAAVKFLRLLLLLGVPADMLQPGRIERLFERDEPTADWHPLPPQVSGQRPSDDDDHTVSEAEPPGAEEALPAQEGGPSLEPELPGDVPHQARDAEAELWGLFPHDCRHPASMPPAQPGSGAEVAAHQPHDRQPEPSPPSSPSVDQTREPPASLGSSLRNVLLNAYPHRRSTNSNDEPRSTLGDSARQGTTSPDDAAPPPVEAPPSGGEPLMLLRLIQDLLRLLRGRLLSASQLALYESVCSSRRLSMCAADPPTEPKPARPQLAARELAARMELAAEVSSNLDEAAFWAHLVPTLEGAMESRHDTTAPPRSPPELSMHLLELPGPHAHAPSAADSPTPTTPPRDPSSALPTPAPYAAEPAAAPSAPPGSGTLWSPAAVLQAARQRSQWHERIARDGAVGASTSSLSQEILQERQVLQYVTLGDFEGAVGFLLASTPEQTTRYFRNALCTISLAAATSASSAATSSLHIQAAKVVAANTAAMGDAQLGVPLLCSVGLPTEAATLLQDSGLWRHAATLAAAQLAGAERSAVLERWAEHVLEVEGGLWRAVGLLTAGGCHRAALRALTEEGRADGAAAYLEICLLLGVHAERDGRDARLSPGSSEACDTSRHSEPPALGSVDVAAAQFAEYVSGLLGEFACCVRANAL
eukprot:jgi/Tetstr1/465096/TSEL_009824.t1